MKRGQSFIEMTLILVFVSIAVYASYQTIGLKTVNTFKTIINKINVTNQVKPVSNSIRGFNHV